MKRHIPILLGCLMALPGLALAGNCGTGISVATLVAGGGTTCTIGDLTFDFTGYSNDGDDAAEYDAGNVTFSAETGGFNLSGNFSSSSAGSSFGDGQLDYTVYVTDGGTVTGLATDINGTLLAVNPVGDGDRGSAESVALDKSLNSLYNSTTSVYAEASSEPCESQYVGNSLGTCGGNNSPVAVLPPQTSADINYAFIESEVYSYDYITNTYVGGTASASFTSADFLFQVPEPGAWFSLATLGVLMILPIRRLRRRQTR